MSDGTPLQAAVARLCERRDLSADEAAAAVETVMRGDATPAQVGALLAALRTKGESIDEVVGAARAMRAHVTRVVSRRAPLVDTCGTGGDGGRTFSISTATALVAAAAGVAVAKHGNRAASGRFGGADVLETLGVAIDLPASEVGCCLDEIGIAFLFAPRLHPAMRHVAPVRRELGCRTIFNLLGPLTNPAGALRQVVGVPSLAALELVAGALARLGCEHALVVHSREGFDEIVLSSPTDAIEVRGGDLEPMVLTAETFGLRPVPAEALHATDRIDAAARVRAILEGEEGGAADVVIANAAAALRVGGKVDELRDGAARAREAIASGEALRILEALVRFTSDAAARVTAAGAC